MVSIIAIKHGFFPDFVGGAFSIAWNVAKMPFVSPDDLPDYAHEGVLGSAHPSDHKRDDWWVDDPEDPKAYGIHHIGDRGELIIPQFEVREDARGEGYGREALARFIVEALLHERMHKDSPVRADGVIPSSSGFWDKMMEEGIVEDVVFE